MDTRSLLKTLAGIVRDDLHARWRSRTDPDGKAWARNRPRTIRKKGFDDPMRETGATLSGALPILAETDHSITLGFADGSDEANRVIWNAEPNARTGAPARVVMGISDDAADKMTDATVSWIVGAFDKAQVG